MIETLNPPLWMTLTVFCGFLFHWVSVLFEWKRIRPLTKALAMILVIVWTLFAVHFEMGLFYRRFIGSPDLWTFGRYFSPFPW